MANCARCLDVGIGVNSGWTMMHVGWRLSCPCLTPSLPLCSMCTGQQMTPGFWQTWKEFEIRHGNEDTIREMLRIKRSVQATYNTQVNFMSSQMLKASTSSTGTVSDLAPGQSGIDDMKMLEQKARQLAAEAEEDRPKPKDKILFVRSVYRRVPGLRPAAPGCSVPGQSQIF
uniref:Pre-mRNA-splicing factor SYF1-like n=2 Tax=Lepisosteus oculatus TaxID=7918 RepID=W5LVN3_LEPOC|nr:PREDICTED: pre-mRNA-splicing factor SYF1-like [Lepisosteus oculatus]XP_015195571.1 PREDICTED: pre-mRNA-splicing factor SYF1-like [Lepisosteus oculatus]